MKTIATKRRRGGSGSRRRVKISPVRQASFTKEAVIDRIGRHGAGIVEGKAGARIYVPFTLPGEKVSARISGERGHPLAILDPSPERVTPGCRHFTVCGGCALQHASEDFIKNWKRRIVSTALANQRINVNVAPPIDAHGAGRRRVSLHVRKIGGRFQAGFMRPRSHGLEIIEACPVLTPALANAPGLARAIVEPLKAYGSAFEVSMTATRSGLDVAISGRGAALASDHLDTRLALAELAEKHDLVRLAIGEKRTGNSEILVARRPAKLVMGPAQVNLPPGAFSQPTLIGEQVLAELVVGAVGSARRIADLFAGLGPFALRLASRAAVHAIDCEPQALEALALAANQMGVRSLSTETRDLFRRPLLGSELASYDAVIFDPPRAGAQAQAQALAKSDVPVVVGVSCEPASFARDARCLVGHGYSLEAVTPVDQFKWSSHIEIVGVFRRQGVSRSD